MRGDLRITLEWVADEGQEALNSNKPADRIEVSSPDGLPKGMRLADLGSKSIRRNALIVDLLHCIGFIEKAGTGIRRIRTEACAGGYPESPFEETGFVAAAFFPDSEMRVQVETKQEEFADQSGGE